MMKPKRPDERMRIFGAAIILKHLNALQKEMEGVRLADDIEYIHRMRVASRRLRSALPLFAACYPEKKANQWLSETRKITRSLGDARDTDVQLNLLKGILAGLPDTRLRPGIRRIILRRSQRRQKLQVRVVNTVDEIMESGILVEIQEAFVRLADKESADLPFSPNLFILSAGSLIKSLNQLLSYEEFIPYPERKEELHAMRISAKQLRYTLEIFAPLYPEPVRDIVQTLRQCQDLLGEIHDCDVWIASLPEFIEKERQRTIRYSGTSDGMRRMLPGFEFFLNNRREERQRLYQIFIESWSAWKQAGVWEILRRGVELPLNLPNRDTPPMPLPGSAMP